MRCPWHGLDVERESATNPSPLLRNRFMHKMQSRVHSTHIFPVSRLGNVVQANTYRDREGRREGKHFNLDIAVSFPRGRSEASLEHLSGRREAA